MAQSKKIQTAASASHIQTTPKQKPLKTKIDTHNMTMHTPALHTTGPKVASSAPRQLFPTPPSQCRRPHLLPRPSMHLPQTLTWAAGHVQIPNKYAYVSRARRRRCECVRRHFPLIPKVARCLALCVPLLPIPSRHEPQGPIIQPQYLQMVSK